MPTGTQVLDQVAAAGYAGIDLGPVGYLGDGERLGQLLAERGLGLAGAYVELPYSDPDALEGAVGELDGILDVFDTVRSYLTGPPPRPTLADKGSKRRAMLPARSVRDHSLGLDADGWRRFAAGLATVLARCRDRGYEPTFHPETGTHVEAPWEIERVLEVSDVGLRLETGHMLLGGGDPVAMLRDLGDRVNHVHLKDARLAVMNEIVTDQAPVTEIWTREAFCALGAGDLDVDAVLAGLRTISFGGWLVVEQDILPRSATRFARAAAEQRHNRAFLAAIDMGVHEFDQLRWLTGQDISSLAVVASGQAPDGISDVDGAQAVASRSGGGCGFISLGCYYPAGDAVWAEVFGTRGSERCDVVDPAEGERAQLEALRRQAESFAEFAGGAPRSSARAPVRR